MDSNMGWPIGTSRLRKRFLWKKQLGHLSPGSLRFGAWGISQLIGVDLVVNSLPNWPSGMLQSRTSAERGKGRGEVQFSLQHLWANKGNGCANNMKDDEQTEDMLSPHNELACILEVGEWFIVCQKSPSSTYLRYCLGYFSLWRVLWPLKEGWNNRTMLRRLLEQITISHIVTCCRDSKWYERITGHVFVFSLQAWHSIKDRYVRCVFTNQVGVSTLWQISWVLYDNASDSVQSSITYLTIYVYVLYYCISMRVVSPMLDCCLFGQEAKWFWISILAIISHACSFYSRSFSRKTCQQVCLTNAAVNQWLVRFFSRKEVGDKFEIVFCSGDRDPGSFKGYYEEQQSKGGHLASHQTLGVFFGHSLVLWHSQESYLWEPFAGRLSNVFET